MKNQQLHSLYTTPGKISSDQALLEQIIEFAGIGFSQNLQQFLGLHRREFGLYRSRRSDNLKFSPGYLGFVNALIHALSSAKEDIDTKAIRIKYAEHQHYSNQPKTKDDYQRIPPIQDDNTLSDNVLERLHAFEMQLKVIREQQLILKAKSLVKLANDDILLKQEHLASMQKLYLNLLSVYTPKSMAEFDKKFELLGSEKSFSTFTQKLHEKKLIMDGVMEEVQGTPAAEAIMVEQSALDNHLKTIESFKKQTAELKNLTTLLRQIKTIEANLTQKSDELLITKDAHKLEEIIRFIIDLEKELQRIKKGVSGTSEIHQNILQVIENTERALLQKKSEAQSYLEEIKRQASFTQEISDTSSGLHPEIVAQDDAITESAYDPKNEQVKNTDEVEQIEQTVKTAEVVEAGESKRTDEVLSVHEAEKTDEGVEIHELVSPSEIAKINQVVDSGETVELSKGMSPTEIVDSKQAVHTDKIVEINQVVDSGENVAKTEESGKNNEIITAKKERLQEAISLIQSYENTLKEEQGKNQSCLGFFHKSRNAAKIKYCDSLITELQTSLQTINAESKLLEIINIAHRNINKSGNQAEITKGGSYFGTSRMLSLQRLLGIEDAWEKGGKSRIFGVSIPSDFHGLKNTGMVGDDVKNIVTNYYGFKSNSDHEYRRLIEKIFPEPAITTLEPPR